jgi:hypothetical protein
MKRVCFGMVLSVLLLFVSCSTTKDLTWHNANFTHATERTEKLISAINENKPEAIYGYLSGELRATVSKEAFVQNYADDRTYPYLTPLYLFLSELKLPQREDGLVTCTVASRLEGEEYSFPIRYENGDYYFVIFEDIVKGTYRDKFANKVVKWI